MSHTHFMTPVETLKEQSKSRKGVLPIGESMNPSLLSNPKQKKHLTQHPLGKSTFGLELLLNNDYYSHSHTPSAYQEV